MQLAEALIQRVDLQKRLRELEKRLERVCTAQEGDQPAENPQNLIHEIDQCYRELEGLICCINKTNSAAMDNDISLADLLCRRDMLQKKHTLLRNIAQSGTISQSRYSAREVRYVSTVNVMELQQQADACAREYRDLDTRIQRLNWTTALLE